MKKPLIIIAGPTAAGKTDISIKLAKKINGQIISADSMQAYKYMDVGSAKISKSEMQGIKHYGIDILEPNQEYNVNLFQKMAKESIEKIYSENSIPIIVGGTGFYIQSVLYDIDFNEENNDKAYRNELEKIYEISPDGATILHNMLRDIDEESADLIHENNVKRVIRALEFYHKTGEKISIHNKEQSEKISPYNAAYFVLTMEREHLYERINKRVDIMFQNNLVNEVKYLKDMGLSRENVSMQGLGYKEILDYLDGKITLEEADFIIKRDTRRFAKRQITWFKREPDAIWINKDDYLSENEILENMLFNLSSKNII